MEIAVVGTGYVGAVTGACFAYLGHHVTCVDVDAVRIEKWKRGELPIHEGHLSNILSLAPGGIEYTTALNDAVKRSEIIFITVGTPPRPDGAPDLTALESACHAIGAAMDASHFRAVVTKSTVPVGCGNLVGTLVRQAVDEARLDDSRRVHFGVASNPEFLREGSAVADSLYPDRVVVGVSDDETLGLLRELYRPLTSQSFDPPPGLPRPARLHAVPLFVTSVESAEMSKYASNAFLAMKIGYANEIANICERVGADITDVMSAVGLDTRIGPKFLNPGLGWGGSCFGKDVSALLHTAADHDYDARLLQASLDVNRDQRQVVIRKLQEKLGVLKGRRIGLLGLAFKPETDDIRDAPAVQIAERLLELRALVNVYDPVAMPNCQKQHPELKARYCRSAHEVASSADALVVATEWPEFRNLDLADLAATMTTPVLVDGRNLFDPNAARAAGFDYTGIGRNLRAKLKVSTSSTKVRRISA